MDRPHQPQRPLWLCRNCAQPWPCGRARVILIREYADARTVLRIYLATCMHEAITDLVRLNRDTAPPPAAFWRRFLAWADPEAGTANPEVVPAPREGESWENRLP